MAKPERYLDFTKKTIKLMDFKDEIDLAVEMIEEKATEIEDQLDEYANQGMNEDIFQEYVDAGQEDIDFYINRRITRLKDLLSKLYID